MILVVNTSFPELNQLAAGLAQAELLSIYVRPYGNAGNRTVERIGHIPGIGKALARVLSRRTMPHPLTEEHVHVAGNLWDFALAVYARTLSAGPAGKRGRDILMYARNKAIAQAAASALTDERAVIASWGCARPVFQRMKSRGGLCVLNYPLAHHYFTQRYLVEEAHRRPGFASSLNSHDRPEWFIRQLDVEIELADYILVGSTFVRDSFVAEHVSREKLVVIPYGADADLFSPSEAQAQHEGDFQLLFVGQIGQRKGIAYLLDAMRKLQGSGTCLTLVGRVEGDEEALQPYKDFFTHIKHVPRGELPAIYRRADAFVFPTLIEGMPLVVLEAMASGLPVIVTPNGPGDIVRDGVEGFLVPPRDTNAIVERIEWLRRNPGSRAEMGRNARQRALEYTWTAYRKKVNYQLRAWLDTGEGKRPVGSEENSIYVGPS